jgi:hypothetical protein
MGGVGGFGQAAPQQPQNPFAALLGMGQPQVQQQQQNPLLALLGMFGLGQQQVQQQPPPPPQNNFLQTFVQLIGQLLGLG